MPDERENMKINALRDFIAVAQHGSLRAAARRLGVSQSALSRSVQGLEHRIGSALFERQSTGIHLTSMGSAFLQRAKAVHNELDRAYQELQQMAGRHRGRVCVSMGSLPHIALLPYALGQFRQRYPEVQLDLRDQLMPKVLNDLVDGTIDFYVGPVLEELPPTLVSESWLIAHRVVVGRRGHPLLKAQSLGELSDAQWASLSLTDRADDELTSLFAQHGLPSPQVTVVARSALSLLSVLTYSDALAVLPVEWTRTPMFAGLLNEFSVSETLGSPRVHLVQKAGLPLTPAAEYLCDMLRRAAAHRDMERSDAHLASRHPICTLPAGSSRT